MLKVSIHTGLLGQRTLANQIAWLDIAYDKRGALADYKVALALRGYGQLAPAQVLRYPRWAGSLWDLVARALAQTLYRADTIPPAGPPDRRCAYATRICAAIEGVTATSRGLELATVEILQRGGKRGLYTATFNEDISGSRSADFEFGHKALNPADLLLRAICWAYHGTDVLGPKPALIIPPSLSLAGADRFHIEGLKEPARTGFARFIAAQGGYPEAELNELPLVADYVHFLST